MSDTIDKEKFVQVIKEIAREVLNEQEEVDRNAKMEELLEKATGTIQDLTETITGKEEELASLTEQKEGLQSKVDELQTKVAELEEKLSSTQKEKEEVELKATAAESALADIEAAKKLDSRMAELEEAKVAKAGDKREAQMSRVKEMSDDEFTSYKEELVELRAALETAIKEELAAKDAGDSEPAADPPDIDSARGDDKAKAAADAAALLNMEYASNGEVDDEYKKLGEAMAAQLRKDENS
jgi:chromosome segregation ATPase